MIFDLISSQLQIFIDVVISDSSSDIYDILNNNNQNLSKQINEIFELPKSFFSNKDNSHMRCKTDSNFEIDKFPKNFISSTEREIKINHKTNYNQIQKSKSIIKNILLNSKNEKQTSERKKRPLSFSENKSNNDKKEKIKVEISSIVINPKKNINSKCKKLNDIKSKVAAYINSSYNYLDIMKKEVLAQNNNTKKKISKLSHCHTNRQYNKLKNSEKNILDNELMIFSK